MSTTDAPSFLSRKDFAALKGWSKSYVTKLGNQGRLVTSADGKFVDVPATLRLLDQSSDPSKEHVAQRHADTRMHRDVGQHITYSAPADSEASGGKGSSSDEPAYWSNKSRREGALAEMAELELQQRLGRLVSRDEVEASVEALHRMLRDQLLGLPTSLSPELAAITDPFEIEHKLRDAIRTRLEDLSRMTAQDLQQGGGSKH